MYFLYNKKTGKISPPVKSGLPSKETIAKERDCDIGSGVKWENVDLFYAKDSEFPDDFGDTADQGKYYVDLATEEIKENKDYKPEEEEWL